MNYHNQKCPVCEKPLKEGEDIVVCPECGAPYHRECYKELGKCAFEHLHANGETWAPEEEEGAADTENTAEEAANGGLICPRCGEENEEDDRNCRTCGFPLHFQRPMGNMPPRQDPNGQFGPGAVPFSPFMGTNTVEPDEEIDGIKAQDYANFVGRSAHYFLPRFKELSKTKARVLNWSAFFFQGGYFLYRKMYGIGILMFLAQLLLAVPQAIVTFQTLTMPTLMQNSASLQTFSNISMICEVLLLVLRFICGFFANTLYKAHCEKKINKIKEKAKGEDYEETLKKKGGVATKLMTVLLIGYAAVNMLAYIALMFL